MKIKEYKEKELLKEIEEVLKGLEMDLGLRNWEVVISGREILEKEEMVLVRRGIIINLINHNKIL